MAEAMILSAAQPGSVDGWRTEFVAIARSDESPASIAARR
jgi:hypothetical protein